MQYISWCLLCVNGQAIAYLVRAGDRRRRCRFYGIAFNLGGQPQARKSKALLD